MKIRDDHTCPLELVHDMIKGKWKPIILWRLRLGANLKKSEVKENESQTSTDFIRGILGMLFLTMERVLVTIYPELFRELILSLMLIPIIYLSLLLKQKKWNGSNVCCIFMCDYNS